MDPEQLHIAYYFRIVTTSFAFTYCFSSQTSPKSYSLRNLVLLANLDLFTLLFNLFIGLWSAFKRLFYGMAISILFLGRCDTVSIRY